MSYSKKHLVRMNLPLFDFGGAANEIISFRIPKDEHGNDQQARIVNVGAAITEAIATSSGNATFEVGTAEDNDAYAKLTIPDNSVDEDVIDVSDDTDAILDESIPAGTLGEINLKYGTQASGLTGQGIPFIDMYVW